MRNVFIKILVSLIPIVFVHKTATQAVLFVNIGSPKLICNSSLPITITAPGRYIVAENLVYTPVASSAAIIISSPGVVLDFLDFSLTQGNTIQSCTGVQVSSNVSLFKILNSTILNFTQTGIGILDGCSGFIIDNGQIMGCGNRALEINGSIANPTHDFFLTQCVLRSSCTTTAADNVITISNANDFQILGCLVGDNGSGSITGTLSGIQMTNALRPIVRDTIVENSTGVFNVSGFNFNHVSGGIFTHCDVNVATATGSGSTVQGFVLNSDTVVKNTACNNNVFQDCYINLLTGTSSVDGYFTGSSCNNNGFEHCIVQNCSVTDVAGVTSGFRFVNNSRPRMINCYSLSMTAANNNTTASPLYAAHGFKFDTVTGASIDGCFANDCNAANNGRAVGYFWIGCTSCTVTKNQANRCGFGFDMASSQASSVSGNAATQNIAHMSLSSNYVNFSVASNDVVAPNNTKSLPNPWNNVGVI